MQLKVLCDTMLKLEPKQASALSNDQKQAIAIGMVEISSYSPASDHIKVTLKGSSYKGKNTWYVFQKHAAIVDGNELLFPQTVKLTVPYYDQLDNSENPYGTCNVTSTAMCLSYLGAKRQRPGRFPDELYDYCEDHGLDRHDPAALAQVIRAYGCKDNFSTDSNFQQLKEWLVQGNPAIVHGYFTASGHIVAIIGFNPSGFLVNDPYGELMFDGATGSGYYDTHASGAGLTYSYQMMQQVCCTDNQLWLHRVSR